MHPHRSIFIVVTSLFLCLAYGFIRVDVARADSPPNLLTPIEWPDNAGIETAFNQARRGEEAQFGLPTGCYGDLVLPTGFIDGSPSQRALILMNAEREARAGLCGTEPDVLGKSFESVETTIERLAQTYADYMVANNATSHDADGYTPAQRIDNDPIIGNGVCGGVNGHQFIPRAENLFMAWTSQTENLNVVERAIYAWLYDSASGGWGHREMVLLQDTDLTYDAYGFNDDFGRDGAEGFIGVAVSESPTYNPNNWTWVGMGTVVVLNYFDPQPDSLGCLYNVTDQVPPTPTPLPTSTPIDNPVQTPTSEPATTPVPMIAELISPLDGATLSGSEVTFRWTDSGSAYHLYIGSSQGASDYHSQRYETITATVTDLPSHGSPIYVRLWTELATWEYNDYVFTAAPEPTPTLTPLPTNTPTAVSTNTPIPTNTPTPTPSPTNTPTAVPTNTPIPPTLTNTPTNEPTVTPTESASGIPPTSIDLREGSTEASASHFTLFLLTIGLAVLLFGSFVVIRKD